METPGQGQVGAKRAEPGDHHRQSDWAITDGGTLKIRYSPRYDRSLLLAGDKITGPALIVQHNSTTLVPPKYKATVLGHGDIHLSQPGPSRRARARTSG